MALAMGRGKHLCVPAWMKSGGSAELPNGSLPETLGSGGHESADRGARKRSLSNSSKDTGAREPTDRHPRRSERGEEEQSKRNKRPCNESPRKRSPEPDNAEKCESLLVTDIVDRIRHERKHAKSHASTAFDNSRQLLAESEEFYSENRYGEPLSRRRFLEKFLVDMRHSVLTRRVVASTGPNSSVCVDYEDDDDRCYGFLFEAVNGLIRRVYIYKDREETALSHRVSCVADLESRRCGIFRAFKKLLRRREVSNPKLRYIEPPQN